MEKLPQLALQLEEVMPFEDSLADFDSTYRAKTQYGEYVSVSSDRVRFDGETVGDAGLCSQLMIGQKLGNGSCSSVVFARHATTGQAFAIKLFSVFDRAKRAQFITELGMLVNIDCDSLIKFYSAYCDSNTGQIGVIIEYMNFGSLEVLLTPKYRVNERSLAAIGYQIMWALAYLHHDNNLHRDIKPGNVLMNTDGWCKLSDFGISTQLESVDSMSSSMKGSFPYMSPERLDGQDYNASSDIWSVGVLMMELYEQRYPFREASSTHVDLSIEFQSIDIDKYLMKTGYPKVMAEFLSSTLQRNPQDRPEASALLQSEWFKYMGIYDLDHATDALRKWLEQTARCVDPEKNMCRMENSEDKNCPESLIWFQSCKESAGLKSDRKDEESNRGGSRSNYDSIYHR